MLVIQYRFVINVKKARAIQILLSIYSRIGSIISITNIFTRGSFLTIILYRKESSILNACKNLEHYITVSICLSNILNDISLRKFQTSTYLLVTFNSIFMKRLQLHFMSKFRFWLSLTEIIRRFSIFNIHFLFNKRKLRCSRVRVCVYYYKTHFLIY